jgi:peroxiredoxin
MLQVGMKAPDFSLEAVSGRRVRLEEILAEGDHVLLIFLRHLG